MVRLPLLMPKLLALFLDSFRKRSDSAASSNAARNERPSQRQLAHSFANAIDQAMALRKWQQAQRLADASSRLAPDNARLSEQLARLKLIQGDPETALAIVESCNTLPASLRLLRAVCQWLLGSKVDTHLDLLQWSKQASAPMDTRLFLALIDWKAGDLQESIKTLRLYYAWYTSTTKPNPPKDGDGKHRVLASTASLYDETTDFLPRRRLSIYM